MKKVHSPHELSKELMRLGKLTEDKFGDVLRSLTLVGYNELVTRSAIDTGFLAGNWNATSSTTATTATTALNNPYKPGTLQVQKNPYLDPDIDIGDTVTLYNNTEYALYLETGTSNMEAQPMIRPTIIVLEVKAKELADRLSRKRIG